MRYTVRRSDLWQAWKAGDIHRGPAGGLLDLWGLLRVYSHTPTEEKQRRLAEVETRGDAEVRRFVADVREAFEDELAGKVRHCPRGLSRLFE